MVFREEMVWESSFDVPLSMELRMTFEFFIVMNFWQNLADLPNENKSGEIQQIREI